MSALSISAVNTSLDELTITAHGLATGAGGARVFTPNGAIPGGLAAVTDYWVIVVDANTVKLATSSVNAFLGTAINITTTGSGTLELLLGLPYTRATTYAASSQVKSADLDALQDDDAALWALLTGQSQSTYDSSPTFAGGPPNYLTEQAHGVSGSAFQPCSGGGASLLDSGDHWTFSAATIMRASLPFLQPGDEITHVVWWYIRGGGTITTWLKNKNATDYTDLELIAGSNFSDSSTSGVQDHDVTGINRTVVAGEAMVLDFEATNASNVLYGAVVYVKRPHP